jgi:hypothetical protein
VHEALAASASEESTLAQPALRIGYAGDLARA